MLSVRSRYPAFGMGDFVVAPADNDAVLAFTRSMSDEDAKAENTTTKHLLCINNLSSRPQGARVQVAAKFAGAKLTDIFGGQGFGQIGEDGTVTVMLGSRGFYWLAIESDVSADDALPAATGTPEANASEVLDEFKDDTTSDAEGKDL